MIDWLRARVSAVIGKALWGKSKIYGTRRVGRPALYVLVALVRFIGTYYHTVKYKEAYVLAKKASALYESSTPCNSRVF